jgi:hypothetical protein
MKRTFALKTFGARTFHSATLVGPVEIKILHTDCLAMFMAGAAVAQNFHCGAKIGQTYHTGATAGISHG